jgi:hypothetical protein
MGTALSDAGTRDLMAVARQLRKAAPCVII